MEEQTNTSRAGSTRPDMHSTPSAPFGILQPSPSILNTIRIFNTNVRSPLLYGSETWRTTTSCRPLSTDASEKSSTSDVIRWPDVISDTELWDKTGESSIEVEIRKMKWGWFGHTLRKSPSNVTCKPLTGIHKESEKKEDRNRLGVASLT